MLGCSIAREFPATVSCRPGERALVSQRAAVSMPGRKVLT